jgi:hypothetical protein
MFDDSVNSVTRLLSSNPTKKLTAHSLTMPFLDIGLAYGVFFSGYGCLLVSNACSVGTNRVFSSHHASFLPRSHGGPRALSVAIFVPGPTSSATSRLHPPSPL